MSVKFVDNSKAVLSAEEKALDRALTRIGHAAEGYAKTTIRDTKRKNTGLMQNSVTFAKAGEQAAISSYHADIGDGHGTYSGNAPEDKLPSVFVGSGVEYSPYNEFGTVKMTGIHFLKKAATEHDEVYKRFVKEELESTKI